MSKRIAQFMTRGVRYVLGVVSLGGLLMACPSDNASPSDKQTPSLNSPSPFSGSMEAGVGQSDPLRAWKELRSVAIGERFICGLLLNGEVYCWGSERYGELGNGPPLDETSAWPMGPVEGMGTIKQLEANRGFVCALSEGHRVWCWGNNYYGQLGDGTARNRATPVLVEGLPDVEQMAVGVGHVCAITTSATLFCWGDNQRGQLGMKEPEKLVRPTFVKGFGHVEEVALGDRMTCVKRRDGTVRCIGDNSHGQLGRGVGPDELKQSHKPKAVVGLPKVSSIQGYGDMLCALTIEGEVYCWGNKRLPTARAQARRKRRMEAGLKVGALPKVGTPTPVDGLDEVRGLAVGKGFACVVNQGGQVYCWGNNRYGQLGSGSQSNRDVPVPVAGIHQASDVWVGSRNGCVRDNIGQMKCWGDNQGGQLGNGGFSTSLVPTLVRRPQDKPLNDKPLNDKPLNSADADKTREKDASN